MKKLFYLFAALLIVSCSSNEAKKTEEPVPVKKLDTLTIGSTVYYSENPADTNFTFSTINRYQDNDSVALSGTKNARRQGDSLILECDNGKTVTLINNYTEDDSYKGFRFLELNREIDFFVVNILYYEGSAILLVNKKTGKEIQTIGPPVVSPNKQFFACGNCDIIAQFDVSGIELFKKEHTSYKSIGLREISNWGPEQMMWKNDTSLAIQGLELKGENHETVRIFKILYVK